MAEPTGAGLAAISGWEYDEALRCVKCGFCLQACPTYVQLGIETASPRGRLALVRAAVEGQLPLDESVADPLYLCLGCRACEAACPSGIEYGRVLEGARAALEPYLAPRRPWWERLARRVGLDGLLPHPRRLRLMAALLRLGQRTGLDRLAGRLLPRHLRELMAGLPPAPGRGDRRAWQAMLQPLAGGAGWVAPAAGEMRGRVAFLPGCVMDALFLPVNVATVRVLQQAGYEVVIPAQGSCCGALHAHAGRQEQAADLGRAVVAGLAAAEAAAGPVAALISNAGGCGAHLKQYGHLLPDEPAAGRLAGLTRDLSEWLAADAGAAPGRLGHATLGPVPVPVTYQESCHLAHGQRVTAQPRRLIQAVPGVELVEMADAGRCCGSAGIYNITQPAMAGVLRDARTGAIAGTGAPVVVTANPGCHIQLRAGLAAGGLAGQVEALHLAELLERSLVAGREPILPVNGSHTV